MLRLYTNYYTVGVLSSKYLFPYSSEAGSHIKMQDSVISSEAAHWGLQISPSIGHDIKNL